MKNFIEAAQYAFAALGGALGAVMGGFDGFLYALVVFVIVDYATGLMAAAVEKKLSSEVGFKGIFKKVVIFCLVAVGHIVDTHIIGEGSVLRTAVIFFYLSNEGISILENAPAVVKVQQICGAGGMDLYLDERETGRKGCGRSLSVLSGILRSYSVIISFTSVGRHFPKNIALQSENPSRYASIPNREPSAFCSLT